jgi:hypothetical protein
LAAARVCFFCEFGEAVPASCHRDHRIATLDQRQRELATEA